MRWTRKVIALLGLSVFAGKASGVDYNGKVTLGGLSQKETYTEETAGVLRNDGAMAWARFYLGLERIGSGEHQAVIDVRDDHRLYGKINREALTLDSQNSGDLRQLAYKSNPNANFLWSVGRFPIPEAALKRNDGVMAGINLKANSWIAAFGGITDPQPSPQLEGEKPSNLAIGLASVYQIEKKQNSFHYTANSLVLAPSPVPLTKATIPYFFHSGIFMFSPIFQISSLARFEFEKATLRNGFVSMMYKPMEKTRLDLGLSRSNLSQYAEVKEIRDRLPASAYTEFSFKGLQKFSDIFALKAMARLGSRSADGLKRTEFAAGPILGAIMGERLQLSALGGVRSNFVTNDQFIRLVADFYANSLSLNLSQEIGKETNRNTGEKLSPMITDISGGLLIKKQILAALGYQLASDEKVKISSGFLSLSYRFTDKMFNPVREVAPKVSDQ